MCWAEHLVFNRCHSDHVSRLVEIVSDAVFTTCFSERNGEDDDAGQVCAFPDQQWCLAVHPSKIRRPPGSLPKLLLCLACLPSSVRDLASCVSEGAVRVACTTPSSTTITSVSSTASSTSSSPPSTLSVAVTYRATPRSQYSPPLTLRLVWSHSPAGPPTLSFAASPAATLPLRRRKGTRSVPGDPPLALFWDLTAANYGAASPEPVSEFYVLAVADAEVVLAVGDLAAEFVKAKFEGQVPKARSLAVARTDRVVAAGHPDSNNAMHTARVRFAEGGAEHEVSVGCSTSSSSARPGEEEEELWVSVDGKRTVRARSLRWNFRGNQTVFVDGAPVDVMWDLHGWWFRDPPGCAVVMLRARTALESRLWLEEEVAAPGFSFVVQAFKTPL